MPSPFPGMDPYLERPAIWPDFHDSLIAAIRGNLQSKLLPKYAAVTQDRLYLIEPSRPVLPDVSIVETGAAGVRGSGAGAIAAEATAVFALSDPADEDFREPYIAIIEPAAGNRVVTAIEVLSPSNKEHGPGRDSYLRKRDELWLAGANLVEIDLLRDGAATVWLTPERIASLPPWRYMTVVTRVSPPRHEVYAFPLDRRLPNVAIPLAHDDRDVMLELQAAFTRCWDEGPYPVLLHYEGPPPGTLPDSERQWCEDRVKNFTRP